MAMDNNLLGNNKPYQAALHDRWDELKNMYKKENALDLSSPLSAARDTAFHLATFSKSEEPLHCLLNIAEKNPMTRYEYLGKNDYGNTALHEAAANGNIKAVKLLVNHNNKLCEEDKDEDYTYFLEELNKEGETALFKAAAYGRTEVVKFLAQESLGQLIKIKEKVANDKEEYIMLKEVHRQNIVLTKIEPQPDASNLPGAIQGEIIFEPKPNASNLPGAFQGKLILEPKPDATQEETFMKEHDASILHVAIRGHHFETALHLLELDKSLAELKDIKGYTSLHLLATVPSAFKSGYRWGIWINRVLYFCLPIDDDEDGNSCLTTCLSIDDDADDEKPTGCLTTGSPIVYDEDDKKATSSNISKGWLILMAKICARVRKICKEKRKHKLAFKLTKRLIKVDTSWKEQIAEALPTSSDSDEQEYIKIKRPAEVDNKPIPLLLATERGIVEIVNKILEEWPQLVEYKNHLNQNILHVAIKHRQSEIFDSVKNMKIPMTRLVRVVDTNGYTILHHAAYMEHETTEIHPAGPVYELQEEIKWYKRVEKITPSHYAMLRDKKENKTCEELFKSKHNELLKRAQQWIKDTSQSCSAVAVLVATVVFAAAYTVPGGSNDKGYPVFLNNDFFLVFTVMDVVALACSLTSVVMFLSVLTSPFKYEEFHHTLPRKLTIGFALLFISLTTTMLAFAATLLLIVRLEKPRWTTTLIYSAAFLPVSIFALTQFPMYVAFEVTLLRVCKMIHKSISSKLPKKLCLQVDGTKKKGDQNKPLLPV